MPMRCMAAGGHEYVDRGDPSAYDKDTADFHKDGTWYDWDLSTIITDPGAVVVVLSGFIYSDTINTGVQFRKNGNVNAHAISMCRVPGANQYMFLDCFVSLDANRKIEYMVQAEVDTLGWLVRGWFKPAG